MGVWADERGQAIQIGAVLLFGALIVAFASYQAVVVPGQNTRIEFSHNQEVQEQLQDLRNVVVGAPGGGADRSVSLPLGTTYPDRLVALNPGPAGGSLRTTALSGNLTISGGVTTGEAGDFWDGSDHQYATRELRYEPNYNRYQSAPATGYENSVLYNEFANGTRAVTGQTLVNGNRLTLVTLDGSLSDSRTGTLDVRPTVLSASTRTVSLTSDPESGLVYEYYESEYESVPPGGMPTFDPANRVRTGGVTTFDISDSREDDFAFRFNGTIDVPATGEYAFSTISDDGSRLYIDGSEIVDNGGDHAATNVTGTTSLSAGTHDITVTHYENDGEESLRVEWNGPTFDNQEIPASRLSNDQGVTLSTDPITLSVPTRLDNETWAGLLSDQFASRGGNVVSMDVSGGTAYEYYEAEYGGVGAMPPFDQSNLVTTGSTPNFDIKSNKQRGDDYAFQFNKRIQIPADGQYTFYTTSDDGSRLYIDGNLVVDNGGLHANQTRSGQVTLDQGRHDITVTHYENNGQAGLTVEWEGPGVTREEIPDSVLSDGEGKQLTVELDTDTAYRLRMARVGLGTGTRRPPAAYLTATERTTVRENETRSVVVEARDAYNNPVSGVLVNASTAWANSSVRPLLDATGPDGRVQLTYDAPEDVDGRPKTDQLRISRRLDPSTVTDFRGGTTANVTVNVSVRNTDGSGTDPEPAYEVAYANPDATGDNPDTDAQLSACDSSDCTWDVADSQDATLTLRTTARPLVEGGGIDVSVNDSSVSTIRPGTTRTDGEGNATAELRARNDGVVAVYAGSAGSSDRINVTVQDVQNLGLVYGTDATARDYAGSSESERGLVDFNVTNTRGSGVEVLAVTINDSSVGTAVDEPSGSDYEVAFDLNDDGTAEGYVDSRVDVGSKASLDQAVTVPADGTVRVQLTEFVDGSDTPVGMVGEAFTVSVQYRVVGSGAVETETFDVRAITEGA